MAALYLRPAGKPGAARTRRAALAFTATVLFAGELVFPPYSYPLTDTATSSDSQLSDSSYQAVDSSGETFVTSADPQPTYSPESYVSDSAEYQPEVSPDPVPTESLAESIDSSADSFVYADSGTTDSSESPLTVSSELTSAETASSALTVSASLQSTDLQSTAVSSAPLAVGPGVQCSSSAPATKAPLVLLFNGACFKGVGGGGLADGAATAIRTSLGVCTAVIGYPAVTSGAAIDSAIIPQIKDLLNASPRIDRSRLAVVGFSAGGAVASYIGTRWANGINPDTGADYHFRIAATINHYGPLRLDSTAPTDGSGNRTGGGGLIYMHTKRANGVFVDIPNLRQSNSYSCNCAPFPSTASCLCSSASTQYLIAYRSGNYCAFDIDPVSRDFNERSLRSLSAADYIEEHPQAYVSPLFLSSGILDSNVDHDQNVYQAKWWWGNRVSADGSPLLTVSSVYAGHGYGLDGKSIPWLGARLANYRAVSKAQHLLDFDGLGKTRPTYYRRADSTWFINGIGTKTFGFKRTTDIPVPADYDGDGRTDLAIYSKLDSSWTIQYTGGASNGRFFWGAVGDAPVSGDFDGDGKFDLGVYRKASSEWLVRLSSSGRTWTTSEGRVPSFGSSLTGAKLPIAADYDGDGKTDLAVYAAATGQWSVEYSTGGTGTVFTSATAYKAIPAPGDYDGDGSADLVVYDRNVVNTLATAYWRGNASTGQRSLFGSPGLAWGKKDLTVTVPVGAATGALFDGSVK